jgi:hypothetical protein
MERKCVLLKRLHLISPSDTELRYSRAVEHAGLRHDIRVETEAAKELICCVSSQGKQADPNFLLGKNCEA